MDDTTPWPQSVYTAFAFAGQAGPATSSFYYEPYTQLLLHLFRLSYGLPLCISYQRHVTATPDPSHPARGPTVARSPRNHIYQDTVVETIPYIVEYQGHPLLFLRVRSSLVLTSFNEEADQEMRDIFRRLAPRVATKRLHGICAYGTRLAFYEYDCDTGIVNPPPSLTCPPPGQQVPPGNLWLYYDILSPEGIARLRWVVRDVLRMKDDIVVRPGVPVAKPRRRH